MKEPEKTKEEIAIEICAEIFTKNEQFGFGEIIEGEADDHEFWASALDIHTDDYLYN